MNTKKIIKASFSVFFYLLVALTNIEILPLQILKINILNFSKIEYILYNALWQFITLFVVTIPWIKEIKEKFIDFKNNNKTYIKKYFKYWMIMYSLVILSNMIIQIISPGSIAGNQESINELFKIYPMYIFLTSILVAPLTEEFVFRLGIRKLIKDDTIFIIVSGLSFGLLHILGEIETLLDILYIIPYSIPGFIFAYVLTKSKNIFTTVFLHTFHNSFVMVLQVILLLF